MAKILLVEDDPLIYRMYQKLFTLEGFETETAENGQIGLDKLATFKPDVILLDIMMPTMNGLEMLDKLKADEATKNIPVAVLTNVSDLGVANEIFAKGAELSIIKSETEPDTVINWIKSVMARSANPPAPAADQPADSSAPAPAPATDNPTDDDAPVAPVSEEPQNQ